MLLDKIIMSLIFSAMKQQYLFIIDFKGGKIIINKIKIIKRVKS